MSRSAASGAPHRHVVPRPARRGLRLAGAALGVGLLGSGVAGLVIGGVGPVDAAETPPAAGATPARTDPGPDVDALPRPDPAVPGPGAAPTTGPATGPGTVPPTDAADPGVGPADPGVVPADDVAALTCPDLVTRSVAVSAVSGLPYRLVDVVDLVQVEDHRADAPTVTPGEEEAVLLACRGTALWDDDTTTGLDLTVTVDAAGTVYLTYLPTH